MIPLRITKDFAITCRIPILEVHGITERVRFIDSFSSLTLQEKLPTIVGCELEGPARVYAMTPTAQKIGLAYTFTREYFSFPFAFLEMRFAV
ncbi:hypothetical protein TWF788_006456 [Orbilia oligospora]|uniref:Uncharacterized protein n=1 Tax=Orbilia oligospora TaxID=2813651 RepID=A0A7C8NZY7_ORBOL|nr:hypothetical protein TWF788_006456 [Orbilia oligospora]KAF3155108.1 hypothetical protein TWF788_006456 [Orbilia oligospora]KAF3219359.1 hypothetical protein TWF191_007906 [Orbilia oligospora]